VSDSLVKRAGAYTLSPLFPVKSHEAFVSLVAATRFTLRIMRTEDIALGTVEQALVRIARRQTM
jgi:hypothetical protein